MKTHERFGRQCAGVAIIASLLTACSDERPAPTNEIRAALVEKFGGEPSHEYTVRGEILRLPDEHGGGFYVQHEAIDNFANPAGEIVGMNAMPMEFPLLRSDIADGFSVGDKLRLSFALWYGEKTGYSVTSLEKLPAETELTFREASPPGGG